MHHCGQFAELFALLFALSIFEAGIKPSFGKSARLGHFKLLLTEAPVGEMNRLMLRKYVILLQIFKQIKHMHIFT